MKTETTTPATDTLALRLLRACLKAVGLPETVEQDGDELTFACGQGFIVLEEDEHGKDVWTAGLLEWDLGSWDEPPCCEVVESETFRDVGSACRRAVLKVIERRLEWALETEAEDAMEAFSFDPFLEE